MKDYTYILKGYKWLYILLALVAFSSCISREQIEILNIEDFVIDNFNNNTINCSSVIEIRNSSNWPLNIELIELKAFVSDAELGFVKYASPIKVKANSVNKYQINFIIEITNTKAGLGGVLGSIFGRKSQYSLRGKVKACSVLICKNIEINEVLGK